MKRIWIHTYVTGSAFNKRTIESVHHDEKEANEQCELLGGEVKEFVEAYPVFKVDVAMMERVMRECGITARDLLDCGFGTRKPLPMETQPLVQSFGRGLRGMEGRCIIHDFNDEAE